MPGGLRVFSFLFCTAVIGQLSLYFWISLVLFLNGSWWWPLCFWSPASTFPKALNAERVPMSVTFLSTAMGRHHSVHKMSPFRMGTHATTMKLIATMGCASIMMRSARPSLAQVRRMVFYNFILIWLKQMFWLHVVSLRGKAGKCCQGINISFWIL